jgi:hypothetical protein
MRDKVLKGRVNSANRRKTHCSRGHPFDQENTYVFTNSRGHKHRSCRECSRISALAYRRKRLAKEEQHHDNSSGDMPNVRRDRKAS